MNSPDTEVEQFINELEENKRMIYRFMEEEYERVTAAQKSDSDNSDENDEQVAKAAAEKFGISVEEAESLFVDVEMRIAEFQKERRKQK